jgi:hypothetical protein
MANFLTFAEVQNLKIGERVAFPDGAEAYPDFYFRDRLTGTVVENDEDCVWVKIDQQKPELDDWDNQIQIWLWEREEFEEERLAHNVERLLSADDGKADRPSSLDLFVQLYCREHGIDVDGDVFGVMFSGIQTEWTTTEAAQIIEDGVRIYGLRR